MSRATWAGGALMALTACSEGYQGDGPPLRLHYEMSQQEALEAMDRVGRSVAEGSSAFALRKNCVLVWRFGELAHAASLQGSEAVLVKQPGEGRGYRVVLIATAVGEDAPGATVLDQSSWAEATQMKWLLDYMRRFC